VNCVDLTTLSKPQKKQLKTVLNSVTLLQKQIQRNYSMKWMNFFN
jgi:CBS domain-containing protein